ncbi:hypothetical protein [Streptomyces erythrochromogenes]|uniref:hypothetical protein n=1 Tax=Streptomyces erythrochromogenes TaxID=285574 RepID=UPI0036CDDE3E
MQPPAFAQTVPAQDARYRSVYLPHAPRLTSGPITPVLETVTERPPAPSVPLPALNAVVYDAAERATELLNGVPEPSAGLAGHLARFTASAAGEPYTEQAAHQLGLSLSFMVRCRTRLELDRRFPSSADVKAAFV